VKKFLAVGLNHFARPGNDLSECVADALTMNLVAQALQVDSIQTLEDAQATKASAMAVLGALVEEAKAGTLSYIGFSWSGHGTHYDRPDDASGLGEALVCYDIAELNGEWDSATIIKDTELRDLLNSVPTTCTVEVWLDTCYSGGMDRAFGKGRNRFLHNPSNTGKVMRMANSQMQHGLNANIVMWCASSEAQESADAPDLGNGAFTYYWHQAWKAKLLDSRVDVLVATRAGLLAGHFEQTPRLKCWPAPAQAPVGAPTQ